MATITSAEMAKACIKIAELHEASYNAAEQRYEKNIDAAAEEALPNSPFAHFIALALSGWWNDILVWAEENAPKKST